MIKLREIDEANPLLADLPIDQPSKAWIFRSEMVFIHQLNQRQEKILLYRSSTILKQLDE